MRKEKETQVGRKEKEKEKAKVKEKEEKQEEKLNPVMFLGFCILTSMQRETCLALFAVLFFLTSCNFMHFIICPRSVFVVCSVHYLVIL